MPPYANTRVHPTPIPIRHSPFAIRIRICIRIRIRHPPSAIRHPFMHAFDKHSA